MMAGGWGVNSQGISVVVPHYGDIRPTCDLVTSLRRQQGAPDLQIIVADDASPIPFPSGCGYETVRRETNGGYGSACNLGASVARHDRILFLNSDLQIEDRFVADLLAEARPWQPAVVSPAIEEPSGTNHVPRVFPRPRHYVIEWLVPLARFERYMWWQGWIGHDVRAVLSEHAVPTDWVVGAAHMMPTAEFRAVGGFDEGFHMNCEETDLHRRLNDRGIPAVYLPTVRAHHTAGGSSDPLKRNGWLVTSRFRYAEKWGGARRLYLGLLFATWINWVWNLQRQLRGLDVQAGRVLRLQMSWVKQGWRARKP